jgi:hypothetical protein
MRLLFICVAALALSGPAEAHLIKHPDDPGKTKTERVHAQQLKNLAHARYVCRNGKARPQRWHCNWVRILERESAQTAPRPRSPYQLAELLSEKRGWSMRSLNEIIGQESGWNPCARYPSTIECDYGGINACGIPQRVPCPSHWRGRLWETRFEQVRWLFSYIDGRYGHVERALSFKRATGYY